MAPAARDQITDSVGAQRDTFSPANIRPRRQASSQYPTQTAGLLAMDDSLGRLLQSKHGEQDHPDQLSLPLAVVFLQKPAPSGRTSPFRALITSETATKVSAMS